ncbi:MAG: Uma2 family endonuclease [Phototrophicaceae bacterium]|jgi:Uma2 family endonuclease
MALQDFSPKRKYTVEEYFELERTSETKHEYVNGRIIPLNGEVQPSDDPRLDPNHSLISANLGSELRQRLRGSCIVYAGDLLVKINEGLLRYPDLTAVCGKPSYQEDRMLLNPTLVVEVVGAGSIVHYGEYTQIPSLQEYLWVQQNKVQVVHFTRWDEKQWSLQFHETLDSICRLEHIQCELPLSEIYLNVEFPPDEA